MRMLDNLLDGVEVQWKPMWEVTTWDKKFNAVANYKQPNTIKYKHLLAKKIKELISDKGDIKILTTNETDLWTTSQLADSLISEGEVVAIPWGGNAVVQYYNGKFVTGDNRIAVSNDTNYLDTKYLYYFMLNNIRLLSSFYRGSGIKHPSMSKVLEMKVPIPPLKIQQEIVRILDTFTELTTELTTELRNRKKQFEYYREQLLTFGEEDVDWYNLGNVLELKRGKRVVKKQLNESNGYAVYQNSMKPLGYFNRSNVKAGTTFIICAGAAGEIGYSIDDFWAADDVNYILTPDNVRGKFVYYYLMTKKFKIKSQVRKASIPRLSKNAITNLSFPIPSLEKQDYIIYILDQFDTLTNSISEGLPKEIELRKKQYEYYREKLLTFPKETV